MCFSQLGDLVQAAENNESAEDAEAVRSLDGTLESLLLQLKQHTGPAAARGNRLDCTLLGAGLKTARQLQSPVKDRSAQKVLHNHSKTLRDIILEEGKLTTQDLLSGYHPEQGWKQPIQQKAVTTFQDLCQGLACVADPQCRVETLLARAISAHAPHILEPLPGDAQALALRVILDTHVIKGCVTPELRHVLRSEPFWTGVTATLDAAATRMSPVMLTGLLETLLIVQRLSPQLRRKLGAELLRDVGGDAGRAADVVILMHMPAGKGDAEAASAAGAQALARVREVAAARWGGTEFRAALEAAVRRGAGSNVPVRQGVWAVAAMVDELATAKVGQLKAADTDGEVAVAKVGQLQAADVYAIDAAFEELRYKKSKLLEQYLVGEMTRKQ